MFCSLMILLRLSDAGLEINMRVTVILKKDPAAQPVRHKTPAVNTGRGTGNAGRIYLTVIPSAAP